MSNNIFTTLIQLLCSISVRGEQDINTMKYVLDLLHQIEKASNEPDEKGGESDG